MLLLARYTLAPQQLRYISWALDCQTDIVAVMSDALTLLRKKKEIHRLKLNASLIRKSYSTSFLRLFSLT